MAVKAIGMIKSFDFGNDTEWNLYLKIMSHAGDVAEPVQYGPVNPGISDVTLNADLKDFIKQYAIDNWSISFGLLDIVRLVFKVDVVP